MRRPSNESGRQWRDDTTLYSETRHHYKRYDEYKKHYNINTTKQPSAVCFDVYLAGMKSDDEGDIYGFLEVPIYTFYVDV